MKRHKKHRKPTTIDTHTECNAEANDIVAFYEVTEIIL